MTAAGTALITGAAGFVGPHLARALHQRGMRVIGLGTEIDPQGLPLDGWHTADLREPQALVAALEQTRPTAIVHLAGQSSAARSFEDPTGTFQVNVIGTWNLLEAVRQVAPRARVLAVASGEIYGPQPEGTRATEDTPFRPVSPYALSKATADALADAHARAYRLDVVRIRPFAHTGPGQSPTFVLPSFAQQIAAIEAGRAEPVLKVGNLDVTRDITDVRDVSEAYVALLERGQSGAAYNVCRGEGVKLTEVVRMMVEMAKVPIKVEVDPARLRPADVAYLVGDPSAIRRDTSWGPVIETAASLQDVLDEFRARVDGTSAAKSRRE